MTSLLPVRSGDAVLLYNATQKKFIGVPTLAVVPERDRLTALPVLVSTPSEAGLMVIGDAPHESAPLCINERFILRTATGLVGNRVYLGVDRTDPLTSTSANASGQDVLYMDMGDLRSTLWKAYPANDPTGKGTLYYGVPYNIVNMFYQTHLQMRQCNHRNLSASLDVHGLSSDQWVFLPTEPIYVCQSSVELCATTRGTENAFNPFTCDPSSNVCKNQYDETVYFDEKQCNARCGVYMNESVGVSADSAPKEATSSRTTKTADVTWWVVLAISVLFLVGAVVFFIWSSKFIRRSPTPPFRK